MRLLLSALIVSLMLGCAAETTTVRPATTNTSNGLSTDPVLVIPNVSFSLHWNEQMGPEKMILRVTKSSGENISAGESLHLTIAGETLDYASFDLSPEIGYNPGRRNSFASFAGQVWSTRRYLVPTETIRRIALSDKTEVRVDAGAERAEGALSAATPSFRMKAAEIIEAMEKGQRERQGAEK